MHVNAHSIFDLISSSTFHLGPLGFPLAGGLPLVPRATALALAPLPPLVISDPFSLLSEEVGRPVGAGVANFVGMRDDDCLSQKDVSFVKNVSSPASVLVGVGIVDGTQWSSFCFTRLNESGMGAWWCISFNHLPFSHSEPTSGKSTQKAFMFMPYRKLAKLSLNLLKLSCIN